MQFGPGYSYDLERKVEEALAVFESRSKPFCPAEVYRMAGCSWSFMSRRKCLKDRIEQSSIKSGYRKGINRKAPPREALFEMLEEMILSRKRFQIKDYKRYSRVTRWTFSNEPGLREAVKAAKKESEKYTDWFYE